MNKTFLALMLLSLTLTGCVVAGPGYRGDGWRGEGRGDFHADREYHQDGRREFPGYR